MLTKKLVKLIKSPNYLVTMDICIKKKSRKDIKNKEETKKKGKKISKRNNDIDGLENGK